MCEILQYMWKNVLRIRRMEKYIVWEKSYSQTEIAKIQNLSKNHIAINDFKNMISKNTI